MLAYKIVLSYLHETLLECEATVGGSREDVWLAFAADMERPAAKDRIARLERTIRADPHFHEASKVNDEWIREFQNQVDYVPGTSTGREGAGRGKCRQTLICVTRSGVLRGCSVMDALG
jgi:hypothetical protein